VKHSANIRLVPVPRKRDSVTPAVGDAPRHEDCWAKTTQDGSPGISVHKHCLNVGCVAEALLSLIPPRLHKIFSPGAVTLAALHDVGKVSPGFQVKSEAWLKRHSLKDRAAKEGWGMRVSDHARISQFTVQELLHSTQLQRSKWGKCTSDADLGKVCLLRRKTAEGIFG